MSLRALPLVAVLMFHAIGNPGPYTISQRTFADCLSMLRTEKVAVLTLGQFQRYMRGRFDLRRPSVLLTFDDGSRSDYTIATPILRRFHDHALAFLIGRRIGRDPSSLTPSEVRKMAKTGLWDFGSHTYNLHSGYGERQNLHYYAVHHISARRALAEDIARQYATFRRLGLPRPKAFAFPFGFYTREDFRQLHRHFSLLFTSLSGYARPGQRAIPRINIGSDFAGFPRLVDTVAEMLHTRPLAVMRHDRAAGPPHAHGTKRHTADSSTLRVLESRPATHALA